jgi:hypothetical protein
MDETLEELVIVSLDTYMSDWIKSSRSRRLKWEQLIEEKLAEARTAAPLYTLEERVDRS